jgi:hypothetical protein
MRKHHFHLMIAASLAACVAVSACNDGYKYPPPGTTSPPTTGTPPVQEVEEPWVCPKGMPAWKCDQIQRDPPPPS